MSRSSLIATCLLLCLVDSSAEAGKKADKLSKQDTQRLLERMQDSIGYDNDRAGPYRVEARVQLLAQDGLAPGRFRDMRGADRSRRTELAFPGWHRGELTADKKAWEWTGESHLAEMAPVAEAAKEAMNPISFLGRAQAKGKGRSATWDAASGVEIKLDRGDVLVDATSARLLAWRNEDVLFEYEGFQRVAARAWPERVTVSRAGRPLLSFELEDSAVGEEAVTAELLEPPPGATRLYREGSPGLVPPQLTHRTVPDTTARGPWEAGTVIVRAVIDTDGRVRDAEVLKGLRPHLDQSAVRAVLQRRYRPATLEGRPVKMITTIRMTFAGQ